MVVVDSDQLDNRNHRQHSVGVVRPGCDGGSCARNGNAMDCVGNQKQRMTMLAGDSEPDGLRLPNLGDVAVDGDGESEQYRSDGDGSGTGDYHFAFLGGGYGMGDGSPNGTGESLPVPGANPTFTIGDP